MEVTISEIINQELQRRLKEYSRTIQNTSEQYRDQVRTELNQRYLSLQMAFYLCGATPTPPAIEKTVEEVLDELKRWTRDLQRTATRENQLAIARDIATITEFIVSITPPVQLPEQTRLFEP